MTVEFFASQEQWVGALAEADAGFGMSGPARTGPSFLVFRPSVFFRVIDGRVATEWHQGDLLGLLQQLGGIPSAAPTAAH